MDILTKLERSKRMALVKGRGNRSTELRLLELFRVLHIRGWRRGSRLPGRPDFVFTGQRVAVFVDGCFWHGCPEHYTAPAGNAAFWRKKRRQNAERDRRADIALRKLGWKVMRIWEHELRPARLARLSTRLRRRFTAAHS